MSANKHEALLNGETHLIQVKKEVPDKREAQHEEEEEEEEEEDADDDADDDEDVMASVSEEIPIEREKKRLRDSDVVLENVENTSQKLRRRSSEEFNSSTSCVMERAEKIKADLDPQYPCFIKLMLQTFLTGRRIGIPLEFCKLHMPKQDESIILVGEKGEEHKLNFLAKYSIFSGGWRGFSVAHKLQVGDVVVFQLVNSCTFNVHIVRHNENLSVNANESNHESHTTLLGDTNQSKNCTNNSRTETFVDFNSFTITVNGYNIDSELSGNIRKKYYELCLSRKVYLHERLCKPIKPKLAAELILGTVEIVDAIRGSGIFTSQDDFVDWDKMLQGFEFLGMDVGFLRSRLNQLKDKQTLFDSMFQEIARAEW